ncbi:MAG TPA: nucleoside-diphosphate sugar epimerase/dehydratase [Chthoniobacterales bacterium]
MSAALRLKKALQRPVLLVLIYSSIFILSLALSYAIRFDFDVPANYASQLVIVCLWILPVKLIALRLFGHFNELLSYFSTPDLRRILAGVTSSSLILLAARIFSVDRFAVPRGVILTDFVLSIAGICTIRLGLRFFRETYLGKRKRPTRSLRQVAIVGAGDVGAALARELISKSWLGMHPVAFFDDFKTRFSSVHGIPVLGYPEGLLDAKLNFKSKLGIQEVIIAMPSAPAKRIGEVVKILQKAELKMQTVPSMAQLASGQVKVISLRAVAIEDLLGRAMVEIDSANIHRILAGQVVMVTGAGGSIGSELCRQIAAFDPAKLLLVERSEPQLFAIEQELLESGTTAALVPLVADILEISRMDQIFRQFAPDTVFHAAAHKHVPMMEHQPAEAVKNNSIGTAHLATLSAHHGVSRFVLISTDKAINPTSVMGASKRLAEMFLQGLSASGDSSTKFMAVRFGNVLGSSGSVVPIFTRQIAVGGPVTVTHAEVTRYFMTIPEATRLVLQSAAQGEGGEIFVLDMGNPIKIIDLARQMIELSGLVPGSDIEISITGLRPGEKLYEELSHKGENLRPTDHPKIMRFVTEPLPHAFVKTAIEEFVRCINTAEPERIKEMLESLIPEYQPFVMDRSLRTEVGSQGDEGRELSVTLPPKATAS